MDGIYHKFHGYTSRVIEAFSNSFDRRKVVVGDIELLLTEEFVSQATELLATGERWYKYASLKKVPWKKLLDKLARAHEYTKGMPLRIFKTH